jgi:predicted ribosome quality control (RQC) complex YloA/Tae2 family protein
MSLSSTEIGLVAARLDEELTGGVVRKVLSPLRPGQIVLEIRAAGQNHLLAIAVTTDGSRIGRIAEKPQRAERPHPFVMLLRREAVGLRVARVRQLANDRAVAIELEGRDGSAVLIGELTSRHANLFWIGDDEKIAGSFHVNRSHKRLLVPGQPYTPPIPRPPAALPPSRFGDGPELEQEIERHYREIEQGRDQEVRRRIAGRASRTAIKRLDRLLDNLRRDQARADKGERLQQLAFALQTNLGRASRGMSELEAVDPEGNPLVIPLDPALDPAANMQRLFERSKRLRRAGPQIDERIETTERTRREVAELAAAIDGADEPRVEQIIAELRARYPGLVQRATAGKRDQPQRLPYREIGISAGRIARIGRSAADNDALTLRHAGRDDLWLHVRGRKGSHVVVPLGRGEEPTSELLIDAAHLAAHFSDARGDPDVEVSWTRRRHVQKPRGAPPGSVRLLNEKTIYLKVDQGRLERMLKGR